MYTWGYIKENTLNKLNMSETEANQLGFLSNFPYYANEAMTQICSSIKPDERIFEIETNVNNINKEITLPEDFIAFSDDVPYMAIPGDRSGLQYEIGDDYFRYRGYNRIIFYGIGHYYIPYKARWFFFTKDLANETPIPAPADICDAIPSYMASQCLKIDDEVKAAIFRNEYEMFLARIDDTSFKSQRGFNIGGGW